MVIVHTETEDEIHSYPCARPTKMNNSQDEYPKVTQADLDRATFRVGLKPAPRKQRVTILLDTGLIEYFQDFRSHR
jgi:hypothetical protein